MQWSLAALTNEAEDLEQIILTGVDITRQREIETELEQLRAAAGDASGTGRSARFPKGKTPSAPAHTPSVPLCADDRPACGRPCPGGTSFPPGACRDISPTGFSFLSPVPPDFQDLMVALGGESTTTYLAARVMHATIVERDNKAAYIVGCRYLSRAKKEDEAK